MRCVITTSVVLVSWRYRLASVSLYSLYCFCLGQIKKKKKKRCVSGNRYENFS